MVISVLKFLSAVFILWHILVYFAFVNHISKLYMPRFKYKDKWIKGLGIPAIAFCIEHIGRDDTVSSLLQNPSYYSDLVFAILLVSAGWFVIKQIIIRLDQYKTWRQAPLERAALQLVATLPVVLVLVLTTEILYLEFILDIRVESSSLYNHEIPLALLFALFINLIYALLQLLEEPVEVMRSHTPTNSSAIINEGTPVHPEKPEAVQRLIANLGNAQFPIAVEDIAYFYLDNKLVFARTFEGKSDLLDVSLEKIQNQLQAQQFFRANKQCIVSARAIRKYVTEANRNLRLELIPPIQPAVTINKNKALSFKEWLQR